ncbi:unnamed protein product [Trichobilharzia regenti]|nr:unnamed protein product [Trichobilharzia regenti]
MYSSPEFALHTAVFATNATPAWLRFTQNKLSIPSDFKTRNMELNGVKETDVIAVTNGESSKTENTNKAEDVLDDTPYTVKIVPTHSEPFELQTLDMFAELKSVEGLADGVELKVVEEAKNHVRHIHDLLHSIEPHDAYAGREQMSLSFVNTIAGELERKQFQNRLDMRTDFIPPEYVLPGSGTNTVPPLLPLHPLDRDGKPVKCVRQLNYSNWNPPPPARRLLGDLIYLFFHTVEDKRYHITACPRGFYVNM